MAESEAPLSKLLASGPRYITFPEIAAPFSDDAKYGVVERLTEEMKAQLGDCVIDINGARVDLDDGWGIVRASSNLSELVLVFEVGTLDRLLAIRDLFRTRLAQHAAVDPVWPTTYTPDHTGLRRGCSPLPIALSIFRAMKEFS